MSVAQNIRALLVKFGISQNTLAASIGVTAPTVSRWLNTDMQLRASTIRRICDAYGLVPDDLLSESSGLYAQVYGTDEQTSAVPLYPSCDARDEGGERDAPQFVEVPRAVVHDHPRAFAAPAPDAAMDRVIPADAHIVVDPDGEPSPDSIVVVQIEPGRAPTLRRWYRGNTTTVLCADSSAALDDVVLGAAEGARVLGVVVWYQAPHLFE
jgi:transcriptional regulator with XRE-family HTH domain